MSHRILGEKLERTYGISGNVLNWLTSFVSGRKQRVVFQGKCSSWTTVLSGIPQGSCLGPLLFTVYVNDLQLHLKNKPYQYADDTFFSMCIHSYSDIVNTTGGH